MSSNKQRVAALESKSAAGDQSLRVVLAEVGETEDQVLARLGIDRADESVLVVVFK